MRCPPREVTSRCSVGRSSQRPVTHRAHPAAAGGEPPSAIARHPQYAVPPERPVSWGSTSTMNPPLARPEPASLFKGPRSGCLQDQVQKTVGLRSAFRDRLEVTSCPVVCPGSPRAAEVGLQFRLSTSFSLPPSHIPSDGLLVGRTPERARGPLSIFRKIHLYGKTKKSTHGHQTTKPFCTHFHNLVSEYAFSHADSNGAALVVARPSWRAAGRFEVGRYRVGQTYLP